MAAKRVIWILLALVIVYSGCGDDDNGTNPTPTQFEISGPVTTSQTWSGTVQLIGDADIVAGVTITIAAGTAFIGAEDAVLQVHGTLSIDGTNQAPVSMEAASGSWGGIVVESGGRATILYATGSNVATLLTTNAGALSCLLDTAAFSDFGQAVDASSEVTIQTSTFENMGVNAVEVKAGASVTITDTVIWGGPGDLVIVSGGQLTMSYCDIGSASGSQHGDIFVSSSTINGVNVSYSNLTVAVDAVSIGNSTNATFQFNNFINNDTDVVDLGSNTAINMPNNYWDSGAPTLGAAFSISSPAATPILDAGPRN